MPIYNVEKYLRESIDSVLNQDFKNFELILVDDGSPDNCPTICDEYGDKDERVRVLHLNNGGVSAARNAGIKISRGEYIYFVDPDDNIPSNALAELWEAAEAHCFPEYIKGGHSVILTGKPLKLSLWNERRAVYDNKSMPLNEFLEKVVLPHPMVWNGLMKASLFEKDLRFCDSISYREDLIFHFQMAAIPDISKCRGVFVAIPTYNYRVAVNGSLSNSYSLRIMKSMVLVPNVIQSLIEKIPYNPIKEYAQSELNQTNGTILMLLPRIGKRNFHELEKSYRESYSFRIEIDNDESL